MNTAILCEKNFNPYKIISDFELKNSLLGLSGAQSIFIGYMRKTNQFRDDIISMTLDFYPNMTQRYLENLSKNTYSRSRYQV